MISSPSLTIIVPIFNSEKYLSECLDSILGQNIKQLELILVNDGSTDNSGAICNSYAKKDHRVRVITQKNAGVSSARNRGIEAANGDYLMFVDADDRLVSNSIAQSMLLIAKDRAIDVLKNDYTRFSNSDSLSDKKYDDTTPSITEITVADLLKQVLLGACHAYTPLLIIRRETLSNVRFPDNIVFMEDLVFYAKLLAQARVVALCDIITYGYRNNESSASNRSDNILEKVENIVHVAQFIESHVSNKSLASAALGVKLYDIVRYTLDYIGTHPYNDAISKTLFRNFPLADPLRGAHFNHKNIAALSVQKKTLILVARLHNYPLLYTVARIVAGLKASRSFFKHAAGKIRYA